MSSTICASSLATRTRTPTFATSGPMAAAPLTPGMFSSQDSGSPCTTTYILYRKGSMSFKSSNARRESITRRAAMRLGGLRVITAGGVTAGIDAALYLVSALVSEESANEVARVMNWTWTKGTVVDGLDV